MFRHKTEQLVWFGVIVASDTDLSRSIQKTPKMCVFIPPLIYSIRHLNYLLFVACELKK